MDYNIILPIPPTRIEKQYLFKTMIVIICTRMHCHCVFRPNKQKLCTIIYNILYIHRCTGTGKYKKCSIAHNEWYIIYYNVKRGCWPRYRSSGIYLPIIHSRGFKHYTTEVASWPRYSIIAVAAAARHNNNIIIGIHFMRIDFEGGGGGVGGPSKSIYNETSFVRNKTV